MAPRAAHKNCKSFLLYQAIRFFRLRGSKEKGARGFAIGLACNFYPTFGLGAVLSGFLAKLFGGNVVAGFIGGSMLAAFWPVLFLLNIRVGSLFVRPPIIVEDMDDVTPRTIDALVWGKTFALGSVVNSILAALIAYFAFIILYERARPAALAWLRARVRARRLRLSPDGSGRT
jgi:uncharacterized protein (DUF2062 family)